MRSFLRVILITLVCIQPAFSESTIEITNAWINEAPPTVKVLAGYMTIRNQTDKPVNLTEIQSSAFERIEFHLTAMNDGVASMQKQDEITIPAHSEFSFSPGSYHLMLFNPVQAVKNGDKLPLALSFSNETVVEVQAEVMRGNQDEHHHH